MLGVGENPAEVEATLRDLRNVGCDVVTFGQYLRPSRRHMPMKVSVHFANCILFNMRVTAVLAWITLFISCIELL
jgi:lipoate synthase